MSYDTFELTINLPGWGTKTARFHGTEDQAKLLVDTLRSVFREGVVSKIECVAKASWPASWTESEAELEAYQRWRPEETPNIYDAFIAGFRARRIFK